MKGFARDAVLSVAIGVAIGIAAVWFCGCCTDRVAADGSEFPEIERWWK